MTMMYIFAAFLACFLHTNAWLNEWDQPVNFQCPDGHHISRIQSYHHNGKEDRRWQYECRPGYVDPDSRAACTWSDYVNSLDGDMNFICPSGKILTGFQSKHDNGAEDRRWKVRCCSLITKPGKNCQWSGYINEMDKEMDHRVPSGAAIVGVYSYHSNGAEDRRWKLRICNFAKCQAKNINLLDTIRPTLEGERIVGIATAQTCAPNSGNVISLLKTDSLTETIALGTTKGEEFTFGASVSVKVGAKAGFLGTGTSLTVGVTQSFGGGVSMSTTKTKATSTSTGTEQGTEMDITGPGAGLVYAWTKDYTLDASSVNVEVEVECDDGTNFKEKRKMSFASKTYGQTHFHHVLAGFDTTDKCTDETRRCIKNIEGEKAVNPYPKVLVQQFEKCLAGKAMVWV